jgi:hypothetical protein
MMADFLTDDDDLAQSVCVGETERKPAQPFLPAHLRDASPVVSALLASHFQPESKPIPLC